MFADGHAKQVFFLSVVGKLVLSFSLSLSRLFEADAHSQLKVEERNGRPLLLLLLRRARRRAGSDSRL